VLVFIPLYWATESGRQAAAQERMTAEAVERGAGLYASNCATCHGPGGGGGVGPALKKTPLDEPTLHRTISRGIVGTAMPAFGDEEGGPLNKHQITDLATFIKNWESARQEVSAVPGEIASVTGPAASSAPHAPAPPVAAAPAGAGQAIFESKCSLCHSIGGGKRPTGPDLKGVTQRRERDWVLRIITSPDQLISQQDAIIRELVAEYGLAMPNLGLSRQEAEEVLAYIEGGSGAPVAPSPAPKPTPPQPGPAAGDAGVGRNIYTGKTSLRNGGAACISCHNIGGIGALGGGTLARDMTDAYSRLGDAGLASIMKTTPFPIMKDVYGNRPLTDEEIAHLAAFFREAGRPERPAAARGPGTFIIVGIAGVIIIAGVFQFVWRRRLAGVRRPMVKGGSK